MEDFPFIRQRDAMQCGVACLRMICGYHGRDVSMSELGQICSPTTEGVSLLGITEAASQLGFHTVCGRVGAEALKDAPLPCILHWNQNHFAVLYKVKGSLLSVSKKPVRVRELEIWRSRSV